MNPGVLEPVDILLVEDSDEDAELAIRALRKKRLVSALHRVRDGAEALDFLLAPELPGQRIVRARPKVVFLDLKLPKIDGLDVLRRIKADPRTREIPVVVLTSSGEDRDLAESYRLGANSYIVKPVEFDKFMEAMEQIGSYWGVLNQYPHE